MSGQSTVLAALLALTSLARAATPVREDVRLLFGGDVLLSRQVQEEWQRRQTSPWAGLSALFAQADWVGGNLEGAAGKDSACIAGESPCFAVGDALLATLPQAGFSALAHENNHAGDLGSAGRRDTYAALAQHGVLALDFARSPQFFRRGDYTVALIAVSTVRAADGQRQQIPSVELAQKLRLAAALANVVVVSVHWGQELVDWPIAAQREQAAWLVGQGADLIVGHHPHVVQAAECIAGRPVYFSLGNLLFDQKYPQSKLGAIADCRLRDGALHCATLHTTTRPGTTYPTLADAAPSLLAGCTPPLRRGLELNGVAVRAEPWSGATPPDTLALEGWKDGKRQWRSRRQRILSLQPAALAGAGEASLLFTLEQHASPLDMASGVRPYVYAVGPHGLVAKWRGSALAWPLLDALAMAGPHSVPICALHRGDSFVMLDPSTPATRRAAYRWNGFGFSGVDGPATAACEALWPWTRR
ncbi:poly-gamma-glutamate synthesis protein (capsule biosynthesis protein) [Tahibacter aquaticus]|uniref:Poly-gamma-glutamate synthesis protein (Capsule biosynthesis protein) n=1 Tax=Tahibacter aquaticus TaxID=520092 RepID=A0A4R6YN45_9GAMM|nr:CapA family protein [Tahibacter aquaticus]TDR38996.1 poly-gamma-glutamate synthesis protein (capsule biosynthesis protein) [Tahibacter aquaticus]